MISLKNSVLKILAFILIINPVLANNESADDNISGLIRVTVLSVFDSELYLQIKSNNQINSGVILEIIRVIDSDSQASLGAIRINSITKNTVVGKLIRNNNIQFQIGDSLYLKQVKKSEYKNYIRGGRFYIALEVGKPIFFKQQVVENDDRRYEVEFGLHAGQSIGISLDSRTDLYITHTNTQLIEDGRIKNQLVGDGGEYWGESFYREEITHSFSLNTRQYLFSDKRRNPFLKAGAWLSLKENGWLKTGYGIRIGGGIRHKFGSFFSAYLEIDMIFDINGDRPPRLHFTWYPEFTFISW